MDPCGCKGLSVTLLLPFDTAIPQLKGVRKQLRSEMSTTVLCRYIVVHEMLMGMRRENKADAQVAGMEN